MIDDYETMTNKEIEAYIHGIRDIMLEIGACDGHCKTYDPATIEGNTLHSYVFGLWDGGRHHDLTGKTVNQLLLAIREEAKKTIEDWSTEYNTGG